jgi:hypothetical protein
MKTLFAAVAFAALSPGAYPAEFQVLKVCEDQRAIRTSDGADAGHVEYVILEPTRGALVAGIVTGGVVGTRLVAVPATSMEFVHGNEILLPHIQRERLLNAPVIERASLVTRKMLRSEVVERSYTHFGATFAPAAAPVRPPVSKAAAETPAVPKTAPESPKTTRKSRR